MLRSIIAIVLILSVTLANFTKLFIYAGFELNHEYIVTELCENRDMPELNCAGQCYLFKKLEQAEEKKKNQERESQKHNFQEAFITEKISVNSPVQFVKSFSTSEIPFLLPQPSFVVFHPPRV
jgi:hypothetical protein